MRCLVMRPRDQAEATAARLARLGHTALVAPILAIVPTGEAAPDGTFAAIALTSANALPALGKLAPGQIAGCSIWVVGPRTAEALAQEGFNVVGVATDGAALAAHLTATMPAGRVLLAGGRDRKREPAASLRAAGFEAVVWDSYRAEIAESLPASACTALRDGGLDVALHYSRRTAEAALALATKAGLGDAFAKLRHLCLSPDVAAPLASLAPDRVAVAAQPDEASLLALIPAPPGGEGWARAAHDQDAMDGTK
jgi:uroporphyrinogen-III synthase